MLWKRELDPFVTTHTCDTSSYLPIIVEIPGFRTSIHIAVYLPTAGQDSQYMEDLAKLGNTIEDFYLKYQNPVIFIRGDANSSSKNNFRKTLFVNFCRDNNLTRLSINHPTYHHFLGEGKFDSDLDVILFSTEDQASEELDFIHCKLENPAVDSHHDLVISTASIPSQHQQVPDMSQNIVAPRVSNTRQKIIWSEEGSLCFKDRVTHLLPDLRSRWEADSKASLSVLLEATNFLLRTEASETNKSVSLSTSPSFKKSARVPKAVRRSGNIFSKSK